MQTKYYSQLDIFTKDGIKYIQKSYPFPNLKHEEIEELKQRILLHRHRFADLHIPIPELVSMDITKEDDIFKLVVIEKFVGLDFVDVVNDDNFEMYLDRMLNDIYKPLLKADNEEYLKAGIDTVLRNYVYDHQKGEFVYVDFMPPKAFYKGKFIQEVPDVSGPFYKIRMICHNEKAGVIYVLYINLCRIYPTKRKFIISKIEQFLDSINESDLKKYITNSPFYRLHDKQAAIKIIQELTSWQGINYYILREAACFAAELNPEFREKLEDFFKLTTHERDTKSKEYGLLPEARFREAKDLLIKALREKP